MHTVIDNAVSAGLLRAVAATWPRDDWPYWHKYDNADSQKLASKDAHRLPDAAKLVIAEMAKLDVSEFCGDCFPDLDLHGAGLHSIPPEGHLGLHLDGAIHPLTDWRRECNAVLFVDDWWDGWGGGLQFWDATGHSLVETVLPARNRLVLFATGDHAWHRVSHVAGPKPRRTISLFWWSLATTEATRDRAEFRDY